MEGRRDNKTTGENKMIERDTKEGLTTLIESLYGQWQDAKDDSKTFLGEQIKKYALKYKEVTGDWYMRECKTK